MARASLGRKNLAARVPMAARLRLCPLCGERKPPREFQLKRRAPALSVLCAECVRERPRDVSRALRVPISMLKVHRRAIIARLRERARRRISKGKGVMNMTADEYALKVMKLPDRIAAIIGKTYAEMGDAATVADDEALMRIRDQLLELDETLIARNKHKRLSRR